VVLKQALMVYHPVQDFILKILLGMLSGSLYILDNFVHWLQKKPYFVMHNASVLG
jgi:hypothetical protein